ncbi:ribbon-helix-helix protein, CopG family [Candidatus Woesearchaeota archaeon]|nr:ribbon-helix-helix protein, CopG family [Candidatus Woesearchaeota archaeon]
MATQMITLKLEKKFLKEADQIVKENGYQNRTELIRNALREKVDEIKLKKAMREIAHLKGASKRKTTEEEYERVREEVAQEICRKFK